MIIYLAGSVPKGDKEAESFTDWRKMYGDAITSCLEAIFIDPYDRPNDFDEGDFMAVFAYDCHNIKSSDLIVVNAEAQLGVGTSQEMVVAKYLEKPVITILPKNSYHRRSNVPFREKIVPDWIHPFIFAFSDVILENIGEFKELSKDKITKIKPKKISIIDTSIEDIAGRTRL